MPVESRVPLPRSVLVVVSKKSTVPVGVPPPGLVTLTTAVNVTAEPTTDGFGVEDTVVVVAATLTVCDTVAALVVKLVSPL